MEENELILEEIKFGLQGTIDRIESGKCKISPARLREILGVIKEYTDTSRELTKTEAAEYLHVSTSTFDRMVRKGTLPKGHKVKRNRFLTWSTLDLDKVL